jgi:N-methylhydantoinase A
MAVADPLAAGSRYIIGIDTGGTFTDVTVLLPDGEAVINKAPTTPGDFSSGVMNALGVTAESMGIDRETLLRGTSVFKHGTTVATNAMITRTGSNVGLLTTRGHEDAAFIMRAIGRVDGLEDSEIRHVTKVEKPIPLVDRRSVRGVFERLDFRGKVLVPLDEAQARAAIKELVEGRGVTAIAICLLFSWRNPQHERRLAELVREMYPQRRIPVTVSHELAPIAGEYARLNTTVANAFLAQTIDDYVGELRRKLHQGGLRDDGVMMMQGNGGIVRPQEMTAVGTLQSGPAGGMIATEFVARKLGHPNVITTDMGGTSFDVGLLTDGTLHYAREPIVERARLLQPLIEVESIGAGGGTIARVDTTTKRLLVGPKSAGADPGPIAYGMGGDAVTVTDANIVLGYIDPTYFLGGRRSLDAAASAEAIRTQIAEPLGLSTIEAAAGIYDVVNSKMSDLIRKQVVRSGYSPDDFVIYAFGGAGPVHAAAYGVDLGIQKIYVFPMSPVFSAFGVATADVIHTTIRTTNLTAPVDMAALNADFESVEADLTGVMSREGFRADDVTFRRTLYMHYTRQTNDVELQLPRGKLSDADRPRLERLFNERYEALYGSGSTHSEAGIEVMSISVDAIGSTPKPELKEFAGMGPDASGALKGTRKVYFTGEKRGFRDARVYDYGLLHPENALAGPAVIETPFTSVVVPERVRVEIDRFRNIVLSPEATTGT